MKSAFVVKSVAVASAAVVVLTACGGPAPVSIASLPAFAGATELQAGNSPIATTLKNNETQAAAMGQKIEQKAFDLPSGTSWDQVKGFYSEQLKAGGWKEGVGAGKGVAGGIAAGMVNDALSQANAGNDMFQTAMFSRGKQTLTVMRMAGTTKKNAVQVLLSLNTN
jgi:hypothetical protein